METFYIKINVHYMLVEGLNEQCIEVRAVVMP